MSNSTDSTKESEILDIEATNRRQFTSQWMVGVVSAFLASCGNKVHKRKAEADATATPDGKSGDAAEEAIETPSVSDPDVDPSDEPSTPAPAPAPVDPAPPVTDGVDESSAVVVGALSEEFFDLSGAILGDLADIKYKLYGKRPATMLAFNSIKTPLMATDRLYLLQPGATLSTARIIAQRDVFDPTNIQIFDNIYLTGIETLCVALKSASIVTYYPLPAKDENYFHSYGTPEAVIDLSNMVSAHVQNYGDYAPVLKFGGFKPATFASSTLKQFGNNRSFTVATPSTLWTAGQIRMGIPGDGFVAPAVAPVEIHVTDALGEVPITSVVATPNKVDLPEDFLAKTSTVVVYVAVTFNSVKVWYRYFFFIG